MLPNFRVRVKQILAASAVLLAVDVHAQAIFGSVRTVGGVPIEGVLVRATQRFERISTTTDSGGGYVLGAGLSGTYEVEAIEPGYTFTPASTNVTISGSSVRVDFTTPATLPTATTLVASNVTATISLLRASVRPNNATTRAWFEYGLTAAYGNASSSILIGASTAFVPVNISISSLSNNTTYHFRVVASNSFGVRFGADETFNTLTGIPTVTTLEPTEGGATTMRLNGSVIPNGANAAAWFEVGTTTNYGNLPVGQNVGSGTTPTNFNQMMVGLAVGTTYHYRSVAGTSFGTNYGADLLFTTGFSDISTGLPGVAHGSVACGDYDNDGRLDILLTGTTNGTFGGDISQVRRNTGSGFSSINAGLPRFFRPAVAWGDYDNDGRLDILLAGSANSGAGGGLCQVWRNTGSGFLLNTDAILPGLYEGSVGWGDYDNDGQLDILLTGNSAGNGIAQVWRNTGNGFVNVNAGLPGVHANAAAWGDYDNDGRLDILLTGTTNFTSGSEISQVWRNTGSGFVNISAGLPGIGRSSIAWGDYDNDGRLDILLAGRTNLTIGASAISQIWRNTGDGFTNINAGLAGVADGSVSWGDYDNDGRLDILLTGSVDGSAGGSRARVYHNNADGTFTDIGAGLLGVYQSSASWGDYDNDGRLDILVTGFNASNSPIAQVWRNILPATNTAPIAPSGLNLTVSNTIATLTWNPAADDQTPATGLTYNLRIGTTPGGSDVLAPMSGADGIRRLPQLGSAQHGLSATIDYTLGTPYYWSVQAVDSAFAGSPFAPESSFKLLPAAMPPAATSIIPGDFNGDGVVSQSEFAAVLTNLNGNGIVSQAELDLVLSNYWLNNPWLQMTEPMKLNDGFFQFALTNDAVWNFSVEATTNLTDWEFLGPAFPVYQFLDPLGTNAPQRHYRLRWP